MCSDANLFSLEENFAKRGILLREGMQLRGERRARLRGTTMVRADGGEDVAELRCTERELMSRVVLFRMKGGAAQDAAIGGQDLELGWGQRGGCPR
mmetsp:Transcript_65279/g.155686  ORF Transcript_65279/g.155686 Transcript_65279/m.155686 type:complete len:96 (-) Transcript_65279:193-480(-)